MRNPFKKDPVSIQIHPEEDNRVIDYQSHCKFLIDLINRSGIIYHPNDQARVDRIREEIK